MISILFFQGLFSPESGSASGSRANCSYCYRAFKFKSDLEKHMRIHTGEQPFQCEVCQSRFTQSSSLYKHMKKQNCQAKLAQD